MIRSRSSPKPDQQTIVVKSAVASRLLLLSLILLWRTLLSPYDTSASLNPNCLNQHPSPPHAHAHPNPQQQPPLWPILASAIESSVVWDGVYFVRIAQCGYEYEQSYAFLPLLPLCISMLSRTVFAPLVPVIGQRAVLGLSAYVINNIAFVFSAVYFYRYSESLYALFSVGGLYHLISGKNSIAVLWLALSGCARSNGILNAGYVCFQTMHLAYVAVLRKRPVLAMQVICGGALRSICIFAPFAAFQAYGYYNICLGDLPNEMRPWCKARIPLLYNYIQSYYWGVGFLRYFQLKQLPNFLLASPILSLAVFSIVQYAKSEPEKFFSLGFRASAEDKNSAAVLFSLEANLRANNSHVKENSSRKVKENHDLRPKKQKVKEEAPPLLLEPHEALANRGYLSVFVLPFILHMGFMAATAFFVMHVQVSTRFLSSSPPLYWFASYLMKSPGSYRRWGYMIWAYSAAYILLGSLLFSNFYPFT
ncbi:hypothetical protein FEM48_Zijuj04G0006600 [Ziziphus jujuba var. spinosa]|uniref:GPI mannosyltransferase 2 n=1 Tax=Ziziphus jujuba var. spinosa TaxID=714518 RepID=A0A978VGU3_ZIZJJ|nr:hypothetical protein FEM48_Zijuj04G0006600 [Ziziphus jujuba var. spinosa]